MKYNDERTLYNYIDLFEKELGRNKSQNTIVNYLVDLKQFIEYLVASDVDLNINNFDKENFLDYIDHLKNKYSSAATIERKAVSTNEFLTFLNRTGRMKKAPFVDKGEMGSYLPVKPKKKVKTLTTSEIKNLTFVCDDLMEECIIRLLFDGALRVSELVNLKWSDIDNDFGRITISIKGKGKGGLSKERTAILTNKTYEKLMQMQEERKWDSTYVIESERTKKQISPRRVNQILDDIAKRTGVENISSHIFRASQATSLLEKGADITFVSTLLGHSSPATTFNSYVDGNRKLHEKIEGFMDEI